MINEIISDTKTKLAKAVEVARDDFAQVRTGRANPVLFQKIAVDYYGTPTALEQLASLQNPEARTLIITPYDKSALHEIEKAIRNEPNLGVNPTNDGSIVRVVLPELTEERRREYVKLVRTKAEDARVVVRNLRRKAKDELDALKGEIGDDDIARGEKELEALTKTYIEQIDESLARKESELLEV
ncbi:ribosome recycling factor [Pseudoclavibacter soli]|uniref:ribosome recycling factor n=1 Tax=Pseudoclavibacter soli TaxID=452623 RepID=UPI000416657C|nr:ribosome recycling factor [Pseudoclavibacter soli]